MLRTSRARRLLVLFPGGRFGGAEAHTLRIADAAAASGMGVTLAAAAALHPPMAGRGRALLDLPLAWRRGLPETARRAQADAARAALAAASPDIALLPLPWPDQAGGAMEALAEAGIPTLVVSHLAPHGDETPGGLDGEALAAAAAMRADWVAVSGPTAARLERFLDLPPGRVATIPNGVDQPAPRDRAATRAALRARLRVRPDTPVALFLGRLDAAKGADHLPELAHAFARRTGGVIACAGTGSLEEELRRAAPAGHPLRLLGREADPAPLLAGADVLALPSRLEGAPLAFLEAASHLLPVAASPAALEALGEAAPELAALADPDDLGAMADALASCLDPAAAGTRVEAAWRLAASWDAAAMADRYLARLRGLLLSAPGLRAS
ncbi:glycosyltransferase family 4 protein [Roseomonas populi]|uniref:Glycosyltransferase family 4 protein n=1 Tax=Roseomonas populi TaxID=3121582 RepID=A0ABT1X649_9PROT|nr:glycosyltransferase family 4 protein [Roseomonas pecuniae]MCR0982459.1 glycosyltransferase family 4 protein [Roseomonas pecuniae]